MLGVIISASAIAVACGLFYLGECLRRKDVEVDQDPTHFVRLGNDDAPSPMWIDMNHVRRVTHLRERKLVRVTYHNGDTEELCDSCCDELIEVLP